jgi:hypothetical protein
LTILYLAGYPASPLLSPVFLGQIADFGQNSLNFCFLREIPLKISLFFRKISKSQLEGHLYDLSSSSTTGNCSSPNISVRSH